MENKLTNEEIFYIFAVHYGTKVLTTDGERQVIGLAFDRVYVKTHPPAISPSTAYFTYTYSEAKLLLTPLDKITDEHAITVAKIMGISDVREDVAPFIKKGVIETIKKGSGGYKIYLFLISEGYAVPLFFGLNHWANGKTAIELKIAIENKTL